MKALIVGAGAVGQVYGQALQRAGVDVSFYVKPKHVDEAKQGFRMYPLNGKREPFRFEGFGVVTTPEEVRAQKWDQLWLAVSATAIMADWLPALIEATGDATVVCLQPGPESKARIGPLAGDRLVYGIIAMIAYQAPLPGEARFTEPGIAYWYPPGGSPFSGPDARCKPIVEALAKGGCPASQQVSLDANASFGGALLQVHVAALDSAGWSWTAVKRDDTLPLAKRAWREAAVIAANLLGTKPPWWTDLVGPFGAKLAMVAAPLLIPIDVQTYFGYHFTKVGDQTRANLDHWIVTGQKAGLPVGALSELRGRMRPVAAFDPKMTLTS